MKALIAAMVSIIAILFTSIAPAACQITFAVKGGNYGAFVTQVRDAVKSPTLVYHGLPMIKPPSSTNKYFYVDLVVARATATGQDLRIGLQLTTSDLYVVAYRDVANNRNRAFYFRGEVALADVFPNIANIDRRETSFGFDYKSLTSAAGQEIRSVQLGRANLESVIRTIYGRTDTGAVFNRDQARFFLIAILTVSEAARFKYIENRVDWAFQSDYQVASMVNNWGALSKQIVGAPSNGVFRNPVRLQVAANRYWDVTTVSEIKPDIGILKYTRPTATSSYSTTSAIDDNGYAYSY